MEDVFDAIQMNDRSISQFETLSSFSTYFIVERTTKCALILSNGRCVRHWILRMLRTSLEEQSLCHPNPKWIHPFAVGAYFWKKSWLVNSIFRPENNSERAPFKTRSFASVIHMSPTHDMCHFYCAPHAVSARRTSNDIYERRMLVWLFCPGSAAAVKCVLYDFKLKMVLTCKCMRAPPLKMHISITYAWICFFHALLICSTPFTSCLAWSSSVSTKSLLVS